jgi:hypothetical protein
VNLPAGLAADLAAKQGDLAGPVLLGSLEQQQQFYQGGRLIPLPPGFEEEYERIYREQAANLQAKAAATKSVLDTVPAADCKYRPAQEAMDPPAVQAQAKAKKQPKLRPPGAGTPAPVLRGFKMAMDHAAKARAPHNSTTQQPQQCLQKKAPKPARGSSDDLDTEDTNISHKPSKSAGILSNPTKPLHNRGISIHPAAKDHRAKQSQPAAAGEGGGVDVAAGSSAWQAALQDLLSGEGSSLKWRAILSTGERVGPFTGADMTKWLLKVSLGLLELRTCCSQHRLMVAWGHAKADVLHGSPG